MQIEPQVARLTAVVDNIRDAVEHIGMAMRVMQDMLRDSQEEIQVVIGQVAQKLIMAMLPQQTTGATEPWGSDILVSYAVMLQHNIPPVHITVVSRTEANNKQILVEKDPHISENILITLTEKELVQKANLVLDLMEI